MGIFSFFTKKQDWFTPEEHASIVNAIRVSEKRTSGEIRVFVESVLRYGLPVDFTAVLYKVTSGKETMLIGALDKTFGEKKGKEEDIEDDEEYHDFVLIKFDP